ncbi:glycoside hydrolase family 108 protein [Mixta intestinalis]|uniref:Uncharacterized protein n=1 Tax=Mixta intestinalis TaxID=1615494 RepID=A0A6P1PVJ0_9GAMM|nr:putative peptidoglycan-binding domain-containing protein [Mixta intestinalis]QHM70131.1 hypothetical protein C7M51_00391 [Mixta intestinalis]
MTEADIFNAIIEKEGDYINHPADKGGPTRWGITEKVARAHGYSGAMADLPQTTALTILYTDYWTRPKLDRLAQVSQAIAIKLCDAGVNMGTATAITWLQRWLNAFSQQQKLYAPLSTDGNIGPRTLEALDIFLTHRGEEGEQVMLKALNCSQGERYLQITETRPLNQHFIYGWLKERITL